MFSPIKVHYSSRLNFALAQNIRKNITWVSHNEILFITNNKIILDTNYQKHLRMLITLLNIINYYLIK